MKNINRTAKALAIALSLCILASCSSQPASTQTSSQNANQQSSSAAAEKIAQLFPKGAKLELKHASKFGIEYLDGGMKLITDSQDRQILLLQQGQQAPEELEDLIAINIPLDNVVFTSTPQVSFLRAFDDDSLFDSIVGIRASADSWDFDAMKNRMLEGKVVDIGSNTTSSQSFDYETLYALKPSIIFTNYGISDETMALMSMLDEASIPYIFENQAGEGDYKAVLEWVKFYAAFYNLEAEAIAFYDAALGRIESIAASVAEIPDEQKVKVGWGIVTMGKVYIENGGSSSAKLVRDCGGKYIFDDIGSDVQGVTELTIEEFYQRMQQADCFINRSLPAYGPDIDSIIEQFGYLADIESMQEGNMLQITNGYWDSYHNIDGKYIEMAEFLYPGRLGITTIDNFVHFFLTPQTAN